jgi:phospholipid/cholesterol/gamma-HCH transport system substrate-binding protein
MYETYLGYHGEYLAENSEWRNVVSLRVQPKQDKFYLVDLVDSPFGKTTTEDQDITTDSSVYGSETQHIHKERTTDSLLFSLQIARRFHDLTLRGGFIESSGGAGFDYDFWEGRLGVSAEGFDFGSSTNAHLRMTTHVRFADYFEVTAGWDDPLNKDRSSYFVGGGLSFADDDLKFLLGLLPLAAGK